MIPGYLKSIQPPTSLPELSIWASQVGNALGLSYSDVNNAIFSLGTKLKLKPAEIVLAMYENRITEIEFRQSLKS